MAERRLGRAVMYLGAAVLITFIGVVFGVRTYLDATGDGRPRWVGDVAAVVIVVLALVVLAVGWRRRDEVERRWAERRRGR